jgi:NADH-quinone oxidoreductase subunit N
MKEPMNGNDGSMYVGNGSLVVKSILGIATIGTLFAIIAVNPLIEFITALVYKSGY